MQIERTATGIFNRKKLPRYILEESTTAKIEGVRIPDIPALYVQTIGRAYRVNAHTVMEKRIEDLEKRAAYMETAHRRLHSLGLKVLDATTMTKHRVEALASRITSLE